MELITALLQYPFLQNALLASFLASIACGIVGTLVVTNRLVFLAGGASHAAYGGLGIAIFFKLPPLPSTLLFTLFASLLMGGISLKENKGIGFGTQGSNADTAIGVLWAAGMAFGVILIELTPGYTGELLGFLFGSILVVPVSDVWSMAFFDILLLAVVGYFYQALWAVSLDSEFAKSRGLPVRFLYLLMIGLISVAIVMLIRVVGLILVLALLTIPPSLGRLFSRTLYGSMLASSCFSFLFCVLGLVLSWYTNISSGASIIAVAAVCYFVLRPFFIKTQQKKPLRAIKTPK